MHAVDKHLGYCIVWYKRWQPEADPKRRDLDDGKYDVTQLANQKASLSVLKGTTFE